MTFQFILQKADTTKTHGKPVLDAEEFVRFYHMLTERPEIDEIFMKYDDGKGYWTFSDLCKFFYHEQKVHWLYFNFFISNVVHKFLMNQIQRKIFSIECMKLYCTLDIKKTYVPVFSKIHIADQISFVGHGK